MRTGLDRIIASINSSLNQKIDYIKNYHPETSITPAESAIIHGYRVQLVENAVQIFSIGERAIADVINDVLNEKQALIMKALNNKLIPEQIEFIITNELYPDLMDQENLIHIKDVSKKTIDLIFKIIGEKNILKIISQIQQLENLLQELYLTTENIEIECLETTTNSSDAISSEGTLLIGGVPVDINHFS